jgi:hypothetical protein
MEDAQGFFGNPGVGFLSMLLIGAIAGWIAEKVTQSDHSIFTNILVGIAGSFVGGVRQYSEHFRVRPLSYLGVRNDRRHSDSVYMASGTSSGIRGAPGESRNYLISVTEGELTCGWMSCHAATR